MPLSLHRMEKMLWVIPVFHKTRQVGGGGRSVVRKMQMVVKDMEPIPDQAFRERVLFQENMAARNLLGMRDMPVFLGNAEVAEDISFGPFVFRLSVGENQHAAAVAVQHVYVFPEALRSVGVDMAACIQIKDAVAFLHFLEDMVDDPGFPGPVSESPAGRRQVPAHAAGEFCGKVVFREERDLIKKIQRFRLPAQPLQGGRHAGVCK